jgi:hypothetical protein
MNDWWNGSMDIEKSRVVADYYYNTRIPQMLNTYGIEDNINTRIAAYNWGIGYLLNAWKQYGQDWLNYAPKETQNYIKTYRGE